MSGKTVSFPDLLIRMSGKRQLPGLADSHVRETVSFPDLLIRMSGKPSASRIADSPERRPPALLQVIRAGGTFGISTDSSLFTPSVQNYWGSSCLGIPIVRQATNASSRQGFRNPALRLPVADVWTGAT